MSLARQMAVEPVESPPTRTSAQRAPGVTLVGESSPFRSALQLATRVARYPGANVLLIGETGTGKELFARYIHNHGPNANEPFIAINCSAIPKSLLESELFGHEKGAFTDARTSKRGLLEVAGKGTLLLDEVHELPLELQPKLLRVLEERRLRRLGGLTEVDVACRIIAAANRDLITAVDERSFRSDLFYRLNVLRIDLPSLRERPDDLPLLATHLVDGICQAHGLPHRIVSDEAMVVLQAHPWLGNVRELKNTLESAVLVCDGDEILPQHVRLRKRATVPVSGAVILDAPPIPINAAADGLDLATPETPAGEFTLALPPGGITVADMEKLLIRETLRVTSGNRTQAARMLGISRPTIIRKIELYELDDA